MIDIKKFEEKVNKIINSVGLSFEEMVKFSNEDFDADNFYDWAAKNGKKYFMCAVLFQTVNWKNAGFLS